MFVLQCLQTLPFFLLKNSFYLLFTSKGLSKRWHQHKRNAKHQSWFFINRLEKMDNNFSSHFTLNSSKAITNGKYWIVLQVRFTPEIQYYHQSSFKPWLYKIFTWANGLSFTKDSIIILTECIATHVMNYWTFWELAEDDKGTINFVTKML